MHVSVVIPALNEAETIGKVVREALAGPVFEVVVADNGSTDGTAETARAAGARVTWAAQRGYGSACFEAAAAARGQVLVFMDGDGADDPRQIVDLVAPIDGGGADLVLGSRMLGAAEPGSLLGHARLGNLLVAALVRRAYGLAVTDLGPFRAIRTSLYRGLDMREMTYGWTTEMMVKAARSGARIEEVPVRYRRRAAGHSKISGSPRGSLLAGACILRAVMRYARWHPTIDWRPEAWPGGA